MALASRGTRGPWDWACGAAGEGGSPPELYPTEIFELEYGET